MKTDETIQAIEAVPDKTRFVIVHESNLIALDAADLKALAAELKLYREFVGAMRVVEGDGWNGNWMSDGKFGIYDADTDNLLATGTDPFDAYCKIRLSEVESKDA